MSNMTKQFDKKLPPHFDKVVTSDLIKLTRELVMLSSPQQSSSISSHQLWFMLPAIKKALSLYAALNREIDAKSLVASAMLLRGLIEAISNYIFVTGMPKDNSAFYAKYAKAGRLRMHRKGKGWEKVTVTAQVDYASQVTKLTQLQALYDHCSELVHSNSSNVKLLFPTEEQDDDTILRIAMTADEGHIDDGTFEAMRVQAGGLMVALVEVLKGEIAAFKSGRADALLEGYELLSIKVI